MPKVKQQPADLALLLNEIKILRAEIDNLKQPVVAAKKSTKGQPRPDVYYILAGVPSQGMPPQALACARILATAADTNHITEAEAMKLMVDAEADGRIRTTQGAWHIFQYYRPRLIGGNYLVMKST